MTSFTEPFRLRPTFAARIWGRESLAPWYGSTGDHRLAEKVGEAWLTGPKCVIEDGPLAGETFDEVLPDFPLLVKMLFPNDKLSVQVHPDDAQAQAIGHPRGKTECWYVLEAEPGATVACGLVDGATVADISAAIEAGTLESLLKMIPVNVGDMVFVDAGTVHAIGPGVTLLEVQQACDITYRLYDYGRPRELHLEAGLQVVKTQSEAGLVAPEDMGGFTRLIQAKYFVVDRYEVVAGEPIVLENTASGCVVGLSGTGLVGEVEVVAGRAVVLPPGQWTVETAETLTLAWCWEPA